MEINVNKAKNNTYLIDVSVEKEKVAAHIEAALKHEGEKADIKGFRKGKAPLHVVKENVDHAHLRSHALNHIIEEIQNQVLKENKFSPIVYPRFEIKEFEEGKDLKLTMIIIEKPTIEIGDYKKSLKAKADSKAKMEKVEPKEGEAPVTEGLTTEDIIDAILEVSKVEPAEQLVNEETDRMMSSLLEQLEKMNVTIDKYLEAVKKTSAEVRDQYKKIAERNIKSDFAITEIASKEGIEATDKDVEETIKAIPDEKSREELSKPEQKMYIKAVLLKNKTLQRLAESVKGENNSKDSSTKEK